MYPIQIGDVIYPSILLQGGVWTLYSDSEDETDREEDDSESDEEWYDITDNDE